MNAIATIISTLLTLIVGLGEHFSRKNKVKRELAKEASEELKNAQTNGSKSGRLDAWGKSNRVR